MERAGEASVDESANKFLSPGPRQNRDEVDFSENPRWQLESAQIISWELQQDIFQKYTIYLFQHHYDIGSIMGGHIFSMSQ